MKIYIAASMRNKTAVLRLAEKLRLGQHEVYAFPEHPQQAGESGVEDWLETEDALEVWMDDMRACAGATVVIYLGGGCDAWAEVGFAYALGIPVLGLWGERTERIGLQRNMVHWYDTVHQLLIALRGMMETGAYDDKIAPPFPPEDCRLPNWRWT